jgi:hypothetical protein
LGDDVALQTSNHQGTILNLMHEIVGDWLFSSPVHPEGAPFAPETALLATEEFDALSFNALNGYYRQAIECLRNALEVMTHSACFAVTGDAATFASWRQGSTEPKFAQSRRNIGGSAAGRGVEGAVAPASVFGELAANGWLATLYKRLCGYSHSAAGYNNADFWESNGPIYRPKAYATVLEELRETIAVCYVLLKLTWAGLQLDPKAQSRLLYQPGPSNWSSTARKAFAAIL